MILINDTLSASLIFTEGLHGIVVAGIVLAWVLVGLSWVVRHILDYVVRLTIAFLDILQYVIFTPLRGIAEVFTGTYKGKMRDDNETDKVEEKAVQKK